MIIEGKIGRERLVTRLYESGISNHKVLDAIAMVPRHLFVESALKYRAYEDYALPIGCKQTISHPLMVARMTELLFASSNKLTKVLEIGTGSGYQTAILALLIEQIFSVERIAVLQHKAKQTLSELNINNVNYFLGDGWQGLPEFAPFDAILVAAAATHLPPKLLAQLAPGGMLVIPVIKGTKQFLHAVKYKNNELVDHQLEEVKFVPLVKDDAT